MPPVAQLYCVTLLTSNAFLQCDDQMVGAPSSAEQLRQILPWQQQSLQKLPMPCPQTETMPAVLLPSHSTTTGVSATMERPGQAWTSSGQGASQRRSVGVAAVGVAAGAQHASAASWMLWVRWKRVKGGSDPSSSSTSSSCIQTGRCP